MDEYGHSLEEGPGKERRPEMKALQVATKLQECKDAAESLLGEKYPQKIKPYKDLIMAVMKANNIGPVKALLMILKTESCAENKMAQVMFMSAVVDLIEEQ